MNTAVKNELKVAIKGEQSVFRPGQSVEGVAGWNLEKQPEKVEVRLFWYTKGRGTEDVEIVETVSYDQPQQSEARPFKVELPVAPYTFNGRLISLIWAVEVVALPADVSARAEIVVSLTGEAIDLES